MDDGDVTALQREHPDWLISTVWASAASGPDARRLMAYRCVDNRRILLTAWTSAELARNIRQEEQSFMRCALARAAPQGRLSAIQQHILASALSDAIRLRSPAQGCEDCARNPLGLCVDHAEDSDLVSAYRDLARHFGVDR